MERNTPVRKPRTSTSDLLTWTEASASDAPANVSSHRSHQLNVLNTFGFKFHYTKFKKKKILFRLHYQPSDKISKVLFGGQVSDEEAQSLNKKKPCSGYKLKDMNGSGIFTANGGDASHFGTTNKTSVRIYQQAMNGISQISFNAEERITPKKPTSLPEVAKQRELSGTLQSDADMKSKKQISDAKFKEISGHDIFAPSPEIAPRSLAAARTLESKENKEIEKPTPRNIRTSVKVSNPAGGQSSILFGEEPVIRTVKKIHNQKFQELTGNGIFKGDAPPGSAEKLLSSAKLKEISGSNIFADGKSKSRDYFGGVRKPPGGESSIALV